MDCSCWISIDPGLGGTGFAVWRTVGFEKLTEPVISGVIQYMHGSDLPWYARARWFGKLLMQKVEAWKPKLAYIELPEFHQSPGGMVVARRGDLVKLTMTAGMICGQLEMANISAIPVPVSTWKGQLSKEKTEQRIRAKIPKYQPTSNTDHEMDAIGIGLHVKGHF